MLKRSHSKTEIFTVTKNMSLIFHSKFYCSRSIILVAVLHEAAVYRGGAYRGGVYRCVHCTPPPMYTPPLCTAMEVPPLYTPPLYSPSPVHRGGGPAPVQDLVLGELIPGRFVL